MAANHESKAAVTLTASLIRQLRIKRVLGEADLASIFGHADDVLPGKHNPSVDKIWVDAQEIIAGQRPAIKQGQRKAPPGERRG
jgi:hypothetical protein